MKKDFVMRGQTASGGTEILEFGGKQKETKGMAYKITEFILYPSVTLGVGTNHELCGSITAGKTALAPETNINFDTDALIASSFFCLDIGAGPTSSHTVINETFLITQNLILMVKDQGGDDNPINWQCRFEAVKMTDAEEAATNFRQYSIFDE